MRCDAKLERLACFDWFMLGKEQELDELAEVWGWGWRGREVKKEQKEGVRHIWRVNNKRILPSLGCVDHGCKERPGRAARTWMLREI